MALRYVSLNPVRARLIVDRRNRTGADGKTDIDENWEAAADDGNTITIQAQFSRGTLTRGKVETKVYSGSLY